MKPIVVATPEQAREMERTASRIIDAMASSGHGPVAIASILIGVLRIMHGSGNQEYKVELEAYIAANLDEMRKAHQ